MNNTDRAGWDMEVLRDAADDAYSAPCRHEPPLWIVSPRVYDALPSISIAALITEAVSVNAEKGNTDDQHNR